eukprot:1137148-Pelagomonas_calceolata.AAC.9
MAQHLTLCITSKHLTSCVMAQHLISGIMAQPLTFCAMAHMLFYLCPAGGNATVSAALEVDQTQLNRLFLNLVRIGETHGVRFPREFGLFLKQLLYFDRYTRILAPQLQVLSDERIRTTNLSSQYGRR